MDSIHVAVERRQANEYDERQAKCHVGKEDGSADR